MKIKELNTKITCQEIFTFLDKRKKLLSKIYKITSEEEKIKDKLKELDQPFFNVSINPKNYEMFFKIYYISLSNDKERYFVKDIHLTTDYQNKPFYEVTYEYIRINSNNETIEEHTGELSLRKFLRILDQPNAMLKNI